MFTRLVRLQLIIFAIAAVVGITVMAFGYLRLPVLLGIGRITVTLELPSGGGLYEFGNVTYRGVQVGVVVDVALTPSGAEATLSLETSPRIPADLIAEVHSLSAVGEQYVDLLPRGSGPPYLENGSVISMRNSTVPQPVGPMLDNASALLKSLPKDKITALLDESAKGLADAGYDLGSLFDSAAVISRASHSVTEQIRSLIEDSAPLLDGAAQSSDATRVWARAMAGVTDQVVADEPHVRTLLAQGPATLDEVSRLLEDVKPTLPVLLANLASLGQVAVTYNPSLEQLLVLVPPFFGGMGALSHIANATGYPLGDFRVGLNDPPPCTVGFLPPSQWRSPADTTTIDTPDGLYCKLPQDSPILVRGLRNLPCMAHPGKRAPTVEICDSDKPFQPIAMRQHALGPYPFDPNLLAQGIPADSRVDEGDRLYAPVEGTPLPPGARPSSAHTTGDDGPRIAVATYDPQTGRYLGPDGVARSQADLKVSTAEQSWQDLVLRDE
ncbi:MCE family protein [Mycolicibacter hiberniae]|uniref:Virulence factor Mce n=1 Tax=Mycolicibacter hiberniae TaxID=29314 RepID=A0A7I7X810_9MYCO|nr:MlaD family protein [Mycolicibacter hiberniae]MCV7087123.1 MCE family protein [Mycolicibacter hiberniae]ORV67871.1 virulence factor Mce [Mycolicibacter hiberniae]BBZ25664.1 virulence factor Mce [Mycolicibacter hiberniae]